MARAGELAIELSEIIAELTKLRHGHNSVRKNEKRTGKTAKEVINIAVIGQARLGISSLINAFMG